MQLRARSGAPLLAEEPVRDADLMEIRGETWFNGFLRKGFHDVPLDAVEMRLTPVMSKERCLGFSVHADCATTATRAVRSFGPGSVTHVAQRAADRLVADGVLKEGDTYRWELVAAATSIPAPSPNDDGIRITTSVTPRFFSIAMVWIKDTSPAASRFTLGSSSTMKRGLPNTARANATRCL